MRRTYVKAMDEAQRAVAEIVGLVESGAVRPLMGLDVETAPLPGLEGYPGSLWETVESVAEDGTAREEEKIVRAKKATYLEFVQRLWKGAFEKAALQMLQLHIPAKTISGKVDGVDAKTAWALFLKRVYELEARPWELEAARWTAQELDDYLENLSYEVSGLTEETDNLERDLHSLDVMGIKKGAATKRSALKKLLVRLGETQAEYTFLDTYARARLTAPVDLRLLLHVVKVAVQGRIYLNKMGSNRLDPVQPGLDPFTSTVFLVQVTLADKITGETLSWAFNTHKVDIKALRPLLELNVEYLGANIKFDMKMLMFHAGFAPKNVFCTRVGSRMLNLGRRFMAHSLGAVYKRYCGVDISKEVRNTFIGRRYEEVTPEQLEYAYNDTEVLPALYDALIKVARERGQVDLLKNFSKLSWITGKWELDGYRLDTEKWLEIAAQAAASRDELAHELELSLLPVGYVETFLPNIVADALRPQTEEQEADDLKNIVFGDEEDDDSKPALDVRPNPTIRISQTEVVKERLGSLLGLSLPELFRDGKVSLGKDGRALIEREYRKRHGGQTHPFFLQYGLWSKRAKQASTYGKRFLWYLHPLTGRVHPSFNIAGTDTARYSCTNPNLLNQPTAKEPGDPDFRAAYVSPEGTFFLGADMDGMEMRIAGDMARDDVVRQMVESGADAHAFSAANMYHLRQSDVSEPTCVDDVYRRGTASYDIKVWELPKAWSQAQVIDFASRPEVLSHIMKEVYEKITRTDGKVAGFTFLFRGSAYGLALKNGLAVETGEEIMRRFSTVYPGMDAYLTKVGERIHTDHLVMEDGAKCAYSEGYGGIRRYVVVPEAPTHREFPNYRDYSQEAWEYKRKLGRCSRELANLPMQGGNAVITAEALLYVVERGEKSGVFPWLSVYDEIIAVAPDRVKPTVVKGIVESSILDAADRYMKFVPAGATAELEKVGTHWVKS